MKTAISSRLYFGIELSFSTYRLKDESLFGIPAKTTFIEDAYQIYHVRFEIVIHFIYFHIQENILWN